MFSMNSFATCVSFSAAIVANVHEHVDAAVRLNQPADPRHVVDLDRHCALARRDLDLESARGPGGSEAAWHDRLALEHGHARDAPDDGVDGGERSGGQRLHGPLSGGQRDLVDRVPFRNVLRSDDHLSGDDSAALLRRLDRAVDSVRRASRRDDTAA